MDVQSIASVCHEANRAYCQSIGDNSQPDWDSAPDWQKQSVENGVRFHLENTRVRDYCGSLWQRVGQKEDAWKLLLISTKLH